MLESAPLSVMMLVLFVLLWLFLIWVWVRITWAWRGGGGGWTRLAVRPFLMLLFFLLGLGRINDQGWVHLRVGLTILHLGWIDWHQWVALRRFNNRRVFWLIWNNILIRVLEARINWLSGRVRRLLNCSEVLWVLGLGLIAWNDWLSSHWIDIYNNTWLVGKTILCLVFIPWHWV